MNAKEILAKLAKIDDMEAENGMNIVEGEEEFDNERSENKRKARIYKKAVIALEELQDLLEEGIDPATGKLDDETDAFYNTLTDIINEIDSRALAFDESLDKMEAPDGMNIAETEEMISNSELQYSYNISVTIDAENALDNKFLKENIKNAVINCLNAYDVIVDVEDI